LRYKADDGIFIAFNIIAMSVNNTNESVVMLFPNEQNDINEDKVGQLSLALEDYKKNYAEFIDIAVHDLQAPLRKLSVLIDRLTTKYTEVSQSDGQVQEWITRINGCITNMRSLIDGLSELSDVTPDSIKPGPCDINEVVKEILHELDPLIKEKKVVITKSPLPIIEGDEIQLKQLFKNILENAIRFSKKNISPEIDIKWHKLTDEEKKLSGLHQTKQYYKIEISDNGIGFKQEYAQKIFLPFVRLNGKSAFGGNGLGLAICKRIVDNHQGMLSAESMDTGARFTLIISETFN
jgi:light-regulated signal transduction histidine kinase (bacteriophytochrome)